MLSADQVPVKTPHSRMQWHKWVVLIAGSTGSALRAVRPPNLHITPDVGAISLDLQRGRIIVALASSHHRPRHPGQLVGKRDRGDFGVSPCQQCCEPGPMLGAMDLGIADHGERAGHEQAPQIAVTLFADTAELLPTSARVLLRYQTDPGREVAARSEGFRVGDACDKSSCQQRTDAWNAIEALAGLVGAMPSHDHSIKIQDLLLKAKQLAAKRG